MKKFKLTTGLVITTLFVASLAYATSEIDTSNRGTGKMEISGQCPKGQVVVGQTNSVPPAIICGPASATSIEKKEDELGSSASGEPANSINDVNRDKVKQEDSDDDAGDDSLLQAQEIEVQQESEAIKKVEVRGWDTDKKREVEKQIATAVQENPQITAAEINEKTVSVHYDAPAKWFGFIPGKINLKVDSDEVGRIKVQFPWYRFLVSTKFSDIAQTMNYIFQNNQSNLEFLKTPGTPQSQTGIFMVISNALKASYDLAVQKK